MKLSTYVEADKKLSQMSPVLLFWTVMFQHITHISGIWIGILRYTKISTSLSQKLNKNKHCNPPDASLYCISFKVSANINSKPWKVAKEKSKPSISWSSFVKLDVSFLSFRLSSHLQWKATESSGWCTLCLRDTQAKTGSSHTWDSVLH